MTIREDSLSFDRFDLLCAATRRGDLVRATRLWNIADHCRRSEDYWRILARRCAWAFADVGDFNSIRFSYDDRERRKMDSMFARMLAGALLLAIFCGCAQPPTEAVSIVDSIECEYDDLGAVTEYHLANGRTLIIKADHSELVFRN